jgi:hypothetical protein
LLPYETPTDLGAEQLVNILIYVFQVDLILDERTACCLLGLGGMKTIEDDDHHARALKVIKSIMKLHTAPHYSQGCS